MRTDPQRRTHIMTIGQTDQQWQEWNGEVMEALQAIHLGWSFASEKATSVADVLPIIEKRRNLDIVFFSNENTINKEQLFSDALTIAAALSEHKRKPWVVLDLGLKYLQTLFEGFGIKTRNSSLVVYIAHERWESQMQGEAEMQ